MSMHNDLMNITVLRLIFEPIKSFKNQLFVVDFSKEKSVYKIVTLCIFEDPDDETLYVSNYMHEYYIVETYYPYASFTKYQ